MTSLQFIAGLLVVPTLVGACSHDCPEGQVLVEDRQSARHNCIAAGSTSDSSTSAGDASTTSTADSSSTTQDTSTTQSDPCDDDPACGPAETPETCPEQCTLCGDALRSGDELCDNGPDNQTYWPDTPPPDACSDTCTTTLQWCGDAILNADESCDNGTNQDPPYTQTLPPNACAPGCTLPGYCGDGQTTSPEPCDDAAQTPTCELDCTLPTCGDGLHNPLAGEACDDNNQIDGDGCSADCKSLERFVFVSSAQYEGDFIPMQDNPEALTGLALADARCQQLATAEDLPGTFKAWLSTTDASPTTRLDTRFTGLYRLTSSGAPVVAIAWQGLTSGTLLHPIDADETGASVQKNVWTNTLPDGTTASEDHCSEWTAKDNTGTTIGTSSVTDSTWTNLAAGQLCSGLNRLYCFQDT